MSKINKRLGKQCISQKYYKVTATQLFLQASFKSRGFAAYRAAAGNLNEKKYIWPMYV